MVEVQRRAVIDEVQLAMPYQHVRVASGAIDVGDECIEPHDGGGERGVGLEHDGIECDGGR